MIDYGNSIIAARGAFDGLTEAEVAEGRDRLRRRRYWGIYGESAVPHVAGREALAELAAAEADRAAALKRPPPPSLNDQLAALAALRRS